MDAPLTRPYMIRLVKGPECERAAGRAVVTISISAGLEMSSVAQMIERLIDCAIAIDQPAQIRQNRQGLLIFEVAASQATRCVARLQLGGRHKIELTEDLPKWLDDLSPDDLGL